MNKQTIGWREWLPLVNEGDALFHIARFSESSRNISNNVEEFAEEHQHDTEDEPTPEGPIL